MRHTLYLLAMFFIVFGCRNDDSSLGGGENPDSEIEGAVSGVQLYFPQEDMLCNEGTNLTLTESTVNFEWEANTNAENYTITIENLFTGTKIENETSNDILPVVINRATPYSWFVEYNFQGTTEKSAVWQFYNAGPGVESYVPFPATLTAPSMAESIAATSTVILQWTGIDIDDDIVDYDVYFGLEPTPITIYSSAVTATELSVPVSSGTIYYWKIVTKDTSGHTSDSRISQFKVL